MTEVVYQGHVSTDPEGTIITCTTEKMMVKKIVITNTESNYTITLKRFEAGPGIHLVPMYKFSLNIGDVIHDNDGYNLSLNDALKLYSNVENTNYYIYTLQ